MDKWDACAYPVDPERLRGRVCYGGLDLSSTTDITAFVLVFPPDDEDGALLSACSEDSEAELSPSEGCPSSEISEEVSAL